MRIIVGKVGGSLFDLPDLRERLTTWLATQSAHAVLLIPGGGDGADVIRKLDGIHHLSGESAHWLALRMMTVNAHFLGELLRLPVLATSFDQVQPETRFIVDGFAFCQADEERDGALEHSWRVTSDSIAARLAAVAGAELVLLKSTEQPAGLSWEDAARAGLVDESFAAVVAAGRVPVTWINLRRRRPDLLQ